MLNLLKILLSPGMPLYWIIISVRNYLFDKNIYKAEKVNVKVVSIGNLTVGGAGKTPSVIYVTKLLKQAGIKAGILSRGYGRTTKGYKLVSDGDKTLMKVDECGDEIVLASEECGVPAAVSERRVEGANKFLNEINDLETIVLDDAYQHRWIHRDVNVLVIDQRFLLKKSILDKGLLPLGIMREPFSSIKRADAIIINRKFSKSKEIPAKYSELFKNKKVFYASYKATGFYDVKNLEFFPLNEFDGQKSLVVCGIARPHSFLKILEKNNVNITNKLLFPDHKNYDTKEVQKIRKKFYDTNAFSVLATQKDAVKLKNFATELDDIDIYFLKIDLEIENKNDFDNLILNSIKN